MPVALPGAGPVVPGFHTGVWYGAQGVLVASNAAGNSTLRLCPFWVPRTTRFDLVGLEVTGAGVAGAVYRPVVYADDGTGFAAGLILDPGTLAADAIANPTLAINLTLAAGLYWLGGAVQNAATTQPTVRCLTNGQCFPCSGSTTVNHSAALGLSQTSVTGAMPATLTGQATAVNVAPRVLLRAA